MPNFILQEKLQEAAKVYNQRQAFSFKKGAGYEAVTYGQFLARAEKIGYFLIRYGIKKKENIAILLENQPNWGCIYFGILFSGAVAVPMDVKISEEEIRNICNDGSVRVIFTSQALAVNIKIPSVGIEVFIVGEDEPSFLKNISVPEKFPWPQCSADDVCSLIYTSGTTDKPKAVMLTQRNFSANINSIQQLGIITDKDNLISILPLHHTYPFMVNLLVPLFLGAKISYIKSLASEDIFECVRKTNVTILAAVPEFFSLLTKNIKTKFKSMGFFANIGINLLSGTCWMLKRATKINFAKFVFKEIHSKIGKNLRYFASGGAKLNAKDALTLSKLGFTILEGYGLTETSPVVSFNMLDKIKIGSVGKPIAGVEVKINNPDKDGIGEIIIKGENVFKGYYKRDDLTNEAIKDGWFFSGDLGFIDKEGFIYITGRSKEVIVLPSGKNIYPEELEVFYKQSPYIKELCILESNGLCAAIVPDMEHFKKTMLTDIHGIISGELNLISRKLPSFKRLMGFVILTDVLPRTRLGKLQRYKAKQIYELKLRGQERKKIIKPADIERPHKVISFLEAELNMQVSPKDHLELDLGIDSLRRVELGLSLEKFLNIELAENILAEVFTVQELITKLEEINKEEAGILKKPTVLTWKEILIQEPSLEVRKKIHLQPGILNKILTFLITRMFFLFFMVFFFLRVKGRENLPKEGPYILCANHASYMDALVVVSCLPFKIQLKLFFLGHTNIFELPFFKSIVGLARIISIDPNVHLLDAMQAAAFILRHSKIACIFPEGQRTLDGELAEFKNGAGILIKELNIPCIPVYIKGTFNAWPRYRRPPFPYPVKIIFGRSYTAGGLLLRGKENLPEETSDYTLISEGIKQAVINAANNNR